MQDKRVTCPFCHYRMPIVLTPGATARGLFVKCKGRSCGKKFEIVIPQEKEDKKTG